MQSSAKSEKREQESQLSLPAPKGSAVLGDAAAREVQACLDLCSQWYCGPSGTVQFSHDPFGCKLS